MSDAVVTIPDHVLPELAPYWDRLSELLLLGLSQLRLQEALVLYQRGLISFGRAAELAKVSETELARQATALGIAPRFDEQLAQEELA